ncbi:hypothetical protein ES703_69301 [subsurface metagenome]|nr:hypothetical protein [Dehalococcoidia bacterium]TET49585.1 MAG: hypothetical protein E3J57_00280 [Dehalococcoidia bacterium]
MGLTAVILGLIGALCAAMGIVTAAEVIAPIMPQFTWIFWFALSGLLVLGAIAFSVSRGYSE